MPNISRPISFSPASITCFFAPQFGDSPATTYSKGCAITLSEGVTAAIETAASTQIFLNGQQIFIPPVKFIIDRLSPEPIKALFETPLPLGCGFGISAACCLSLAFAIAKRHGLKLPPKDLAAIAHEAEVTFKTGLGDVTSQLYGGVVYRHCQPGPLDAQRLEIPVQPVYFRIFGDFETSAALNDPKIVRTIADKGAKANQWLQNNINKLTLANLLATGHKFAQDSSLITNEEVRNCISEVLTAGGQATMIMLGQAVLSTIAAGDQNKWTKCTIAEQGAKYLENGHPN